ncbi:MAG: zinc ABC transporter solute-binding protein [Nitrososphaeria archaeon]|nr:zinc ABC transporter solute-binding protein [Nitrosopumilaceae archaeon]NIP09850.1 zinc ABC transporter solute-binding protein [Nitrosopumilaceae archaeon]NIP91874.1 zinc ABC transporter solute-binding protein [Nitrososphaeria archaeon]NIS95933.1 zinc ABC transporter solute-binding protein [Nitrosopumilaceae archaeon]
MNNQMKLAILAIIVVIPLVSFSVWATDSNLQVKQIEDSTKIQAIASFYPLYDFAKEVGKDKVDVQLLVPAGVEPHDWEPTIQDVQLMQKSNLIIINGIGFENWVDSLVELNYSGEIVDTSVGIIIPDSEIIDEHEADEHEADEHEADEHEADEHNHESGDPHIWLNPVLAKIQVQNIADAFSQHDPQNQQFYETNAKNYIKKLDNLDNQIRNELSTCNRDFIAFHDAFSYFADEYDLHQHTIISSNDPHAEPTAKTLENVINTARELQIQIIFTEETVDTRVSSVIANEIGGKILVLSPIEIGEDGNYISRMTQNLDNLKEALC